MTFTSIGITLLGLSAIGAGAMIAFPKDKSYVSGSRKLYGGAIVCFGIALAYFGLSDLFTPRVSFPDPVVVYTLKGCPHCTTAKDTLAANGVQYSEIETLPGQQPPVMPDGTQPKYFPTIFIGNVNIGGNEGLAREIEHAQTPTVNSI